MSNTVQLGIIGVNGRGLGLGKVWAMDKRCRISAVCDIRQDRLDSARAVLGNEGISYYQDFHQLLADERVNTVLIATNDKTHAAVAVPTLQAGKHLFLEKPMAQTIEDCDAIINAWKGTNTIFYVGLELRYCSLCTVMKQVIDRGDIGDIRLGYAVDNVSVGERYYFHDDRRRSDYIVSLLLEKGTHTLDLMNWFVGSQPERVYAEGGLDVFGGDAENDLTCPECEKKRSCPYAVLDETLTMDYGEKVDAKNKCVFAREVDVHDNSVVTVRYANGAKITYVETHFSPDYNRHFTLVGTKGRMYGFYNNEQDFRIELTYRHTERRDVIYPPRVESIGGHGGGDEGIMHSFFDRLEEGTPCAPGVIGARNSAAIAIAAHHASQTGTVQHISPCPLDPQVYGY